MGGGQKGNVETRALRGLQIGCMHPKGAQVNHGAQEKPDPIFEFVI